MTISVTLAAIYLVMIKVSTTKIIHCGMVRDVLLLAAAVSSTLLHGFVSNYLYLNYFIIGLYFSLPPMTLRLDCDKLLS